MIPRRHCEQERIEEMKREIEEEAEKECTFAPIIDKRSHKMMSQRALVLKVDTSASAVGFPHMALTLQSPDNTLPYCTTALPSRVTKG